MANMHDGQVDMPLRQSTRISRLPDRFVPGIDYVMLTDCGELSCYKEAMLRDDKRKCKLAMQSKMDSLGKNDTWDLVSLPREKHALPFKWVFKMKVTGDVVPKYKAWLVAKGFKQEKRVDFDKIFLQVVKMTNSDVYLAWWQDRKSVV